MGSRVGRAGGASPPSHVTYYTATAAIVGLLLMLCFYFFYYFIKRVKELSREESPAQPASVTAPTPAPTVTTAYPVQPVVRESATAMAKLCKQLPPSTIAGKSGTVFPASTSPAAQRTRHDNHHDVITSTPSEVSKTVGLHVPRDAATTLIQTPPAR